MYGQLFKAQRKHQVALEVLSYHCCVTEKETQQCLEAASACALPNDFYRYVYKESAITTHCRYPYHHFALDRIKQENKAFNFTFSFISLFALS